MISLETVLKILSISPVNHRWLHQIRDLSEQRLKLVEISVVREFPPGLPPSPEGHFAAGALFLFFACEGSGKANVPD